MKKSSNGYYENPINALTCSQNVKNSNNLPVQFVYDNQILNPDYDECLGYYSDLNTVDEKMQRIHLDEKIQPIPQLKHWSEVVYDCMEIQLADWNIAGGSDYGQLTYFIDSGDILLEIDNQKISGYTRNNVLSIVNKQKYHSIKAVSSSSSFGLPIVLKEYLSRKFSRNSIDHELQSVIRDNVYARTIPCTTRPAKPNEVDGIDYKFVSKEEFLEMERNGVLLESGIYAGHHYGTPLPLSNSNTPTHIQSKIFSANENEINLSTSEKLNNIIEQKVNNLNIDLSNSQINYNDLKDSQQPSALALKRRRNRSNIAAIDASSLPHGWEKISDAHYGVYYIDHINKRTQYERPYEVELIKGSNGFGFTLIELDKGLVIVKTIIQGGSASISGIIQPGDILVSVSGVSVSGLQNSDIAKLFSTFAIGDRVKLTFARGPNLHNKMIDDSDLNNEEEYSLISVVIKKGENGFGFTISDGNVGQKVKKILDVERCGFLKQGDLLASVNGIDLTNLNHVEVVEVLKNHCSIGQDIIFIVKRKESIGNKIPISLNQSNDEKKILMRNCKTPNCEIINKDWENENKIFATSDNEKVPKDNANYTLEENLNTNNYDASHLKQIYNCNQFTLSNKNLSNTCVQQNLNAKLNETMLKELKTTLAINNNQMRLKNDSTNNENVNSSDKNISSFNLNDLVNSSNVNETDLSTNNIYTVLNNQDSYYQENFDKNLNLISNTNKDEVNEDEYEYFRVFLNRGEMGFGFRIVGGAEENRNVTIGSIVIGGVAHVDGILRAGDELISINDQNVTSASHYHVVELISQCGNSVSLLVRRKKDSDAFDVVLNRDINEGFGFIIISCGNCALIGRIIDNSPAQRCQRLKIRDKIIAVNGVDITELSHPDIVNMIKDSGLTLRLRIIPADCYTVELIRGPKGFGFSIRGGVEFNGMPLFILRIAPDGPACNLLNIGDEIVEINSISTIGITHAEAVLLISQSGPQVKLKLRRRDVLTNTTSLNNFNGAVNNETYPYYMQ